MNSSKDGGFDSTDDRRLTTNLAIHNHLQANYLPISNASNYLPISGASTANVFVSSITASTANLQSAVILYPQVDRITLAGPSYGGDPVREFGRLKTNYHQILSTDTVSQNDPNGANTNQPISCQSLLDAAANASFTTQGTGEHLLPPSGSSINTHLTTNYVPKSDVVNNSTFSTNNIFTASDVKPPSELAVRVGLDTKPTAQLLSYTAGQPIILGSNNSAVISDTVLNHYAVPIPTSGSGAGKIVARNTNNDGWEFVSSTGSSSSLLIDAHTNATSTATKTGQTIGTGIFYQNVSQLRVQYKSSSSNFQDVLIGLFDTTSPVITILGTNPISITVNNTYTDAGATALDSIDGDVTSQIQTTGTVDTTTLGSYYITYTVSDNAGNIASAIRTVNVMDLGLFYSYDFTDTGGSLNGTTFTFADGRTATLSGPGTSSTWNSADGIYVAPGNLLNLPTFQLGGNFSLEILFKWGDVSTKIGWQEIFYFTSLDPNFSWATIQLVRDYNQLDSLFVGISGYYTAFGNTPTPGTTFERVVFTLNQIAVNIATVNVYMNGTQVATGLGSPMPNVTFEDHYFGGIRTSYPGNVRMKYMKFYNRALTEAEVQSL